MGAAPSSARSLGDAPRHDSQLGPDNTALWGPGRWRMLHVRAIYFPMTPSAQDRSCENAFLDSFLRRLPCPECVSHATEYLKNNSPLLDGSAAYQLWVFTFHNSVNTRKGKPLISWTEYEELYRADIAAAGFQK